MAPLHEYKFDTKDKASEISNKDAFARDLILASFAAQGSWAQFYSGMRLTLGTFFVGAAFGILTFRWETPSWRLAIAAAVLALLGLVFFFVFSEFARDKRDEQLKLSNCLRTPLGVDHLPIVAGFDRFEALVTVTFIGFFVIFEALFCWGIR